MPFFSSKEPQRWLILRLHSTTIRGIEDAVEIVETIVIIVVTALIHDERKDFGKTSRIKNLPTINKIQMTKIQKNPKIVGITKRIKIPTIVHFRVTRNKSFPRTNSSPIGKGRLMIRLRTIGHVQM
jgi:hypothetical protein